MTTSIKSKKLQNFYFQESIVLVNTEQKGFQTLLKAMLKTLMFRKIHINKANQRLTQKKNLL